ncbi:MAG: PilZ domain-containing protein [Planctomycetes bacterium]|nr:PilZ domain-containing protein [Planctomycetota bacterium]
MTPLEKERRAHPRANAPEIPLTLIGSDEVLRVRDISQSGVAFYSESPVPLMTRVQFQIQLPDSARDTEQTVVGEGAVVRCERLSPALGHYEIAVFFQHLEKGCLDHLQDYMQRALP